MSDFVLYRETELIYEGPESTSVEHFINVFKRDMRVALQDTKKVFPGKIYIRLEKENRRLQDEQFSFTVADENLHVRAKDELGAIYALLYLSETYLGVDRFWFWNDLSPQQVEYRTIHLVDYLSPPSRVRYRGWFVNDEVLLSQWTYAGSNEKVWEMVFETILRCKGNMVIPGTDIQDPTYKKIAVQMGLWLTHHHSEPLGAEMFSRVYPDQVPSYVENKDLFLHLWRTAIKEQKNDKVIWNIGFRGQGDRPFWSDDPAFDTDEKRGKLIGDIIQDQYELISQYQSDPVCCVNLYGEVTELYKKGFLKIPEQVIKVWADSGYGKMVSRRQNNNNPRSVSQPNSQSEGLHGIYYHVTFYDLQASNHLTMFPNSPDFLQEELNRSFEKGMDEFLIVNCGNIRPHLFYLDLISKIWQNGRTKICQFETDYFRRVFPDHSEKIKTAFRMFQEAIVHYGQHEDERAGEQFYYYSIRYLTQSWLTGQTEGNARLQWATGEKDLSGQFKWMEHIISNQLSAWETLYRYVVPLMDLSSAEGKRLYDQFYLQVVIHRNGIFTLNHLCNSYKYWERKDYLQSFLEISEAYDAVKQVKEEMEKSTQSKWQGFYANDCLTNISLVLEIIDTLRKYIRMVGDGPNYYTWEKKYLDDKSESSVMLLTNKKKQLTNDELFKRLKAKKSNECKNK